MRDSTISILASLQNVIKADSDQKSSCEIIKASYQIALTYLSIIHKNTIENLFQDGTCIEDIAADVIAPLLFKNEDGHLFALIHAFEKYQPVLKTEEDAIYFLNKTISMQVEKCVSFWIKKNDQLFSNILSSIKQLVNKEGYKTINYFGSNYIVEKEVKQISGFVLDENNIGLLPAELFSSKNEILKSILDYLYNENSYFPAIPVNALVEHLKKHYSKNYSCESSINKSIKPLDQKKRFKIEFGITKQNLERGFDLGGNPFSENTEI